MPGTYTLIATNDCGADTATTTVVQIPAVNVDALPNIITPNGDGINDVYTVGGLFYNTQPFYVQVHNRWGTKVYDSDDPQINWTAEHLNDGVYYMTIIYTDCNHEQKKLSQTVTVTGSR